MIMKKIMKLIGLLTLIIFSFFYTDKVIEVIREEDEIMIKIKAEQEKYYIKPINATTVGDTIIPGIQGRKVDVESSYKKMKEQGIYNPNLLIYETIDPKLRLETQKEKYIISGNPQKLMVSLLFPLTNNRYFESFDKILTTKNIPGNFFVDYTYLISNSTLLKEKSHHEFYSYGQNGEYSPDTLLFSNNLISRITKNNAIYCLTIAPKEETLNLCSKNNLYTLTPNIIGNKNPYQNIKTYLTSGSMIFLEMNKETLSELPTIIDYIKGKGYQITVLSKLLSENNNDI